MAVIGIYFAPTWPAKDQQATRMVRDALAPLEAGSSLLLRWGPERAAEVFDRFAVQEFRPSIKKGFGGKISDGQDEMPEEMQTSGAVARLAQALGAGGHGGGIFGSHVTSARGSLSFKARTMVEVAMFAQACDVCFAFWDGEDRTGEFILRGLKRLKLPIRITYPNYVLQLAREFNSGL